MSYHQRVSLDPEAEARDHADDAAEPRAESLRPYHGYLPEAAPVTGLASWLQHAIAQDWREHPERWSRYYGQLSELLYDGPWCDFEDPAVQAELREPNQPAHPSDITDQIMPAAAAAIAFLDGARVIAFGEETLA